MRWSEVNQTHHRKKARVTTVSKGVIATHTGTIKCGGELYLPILISKGNTLMSFLPACEVEILDEVG